MKAFRWIFMVPVALVAAMLGSFTGGLALSVFGNQLTMDAASAFLGSFMLVFAAGFVAPSKRGRTTLVFLCIIAVLTLLSLIAAIVTDFEGLGDQPPLRKVLIPVSQILGALYAAFILPPLATPGTLLEQLWKEISSLGAVVILFGVIASVAGLLARVFAGTWAGLTTGMGIIVLGIATWFFPFIHLLFRMRRIPAAMEEIMNQDKNSVIDGEPIDELTNKAIDGA